MKKILLSIVFFSIIVSLTGCGSGSGGSSSEPKGVNPGIPSRVQLLDVQNVVQTNSYIYFKAKIIDGNGEPVRNEPVIFTNLSYPFGELVDEFTASSVPGIASVQTTVNTDDLGFATIRLFSPTSGFATVQAEVDTGAGWVRDRRTVYFTTGSLNLSPYLILDVDGDDNGTFDEASDFILFEDTDDNMVRIRATVYSGIGQPVSGTTVTFATDSPYRVGPDIDASCSDGSDTCEVFFPFGNTATTNSSGQTSGYIQVNPTILRSNSTVLNVTATDSYYGAFNLLTLFLDPVVVSPGAVSVFADPNVVDSGGTSEITASAITNLGTQLPEGTAVNFTTTAGGIDPFAQIDADGVATVTYTAPTLAEGALDQTASITATVGGVSGSTSVTVIAPEVSTSLAISPTSSAVTEAVSAQTLDFQVTGGLPPYDITSSSPAIACDDIDPAGGNDLCSDPGDSGTWTVNTDGGTFTVTIPAGDIVAADSTVTLTVTDSASSPIAQATITITDAI